MSYSVHYKSFTNNRYPQYKQKLSKKSVVVFISCLMVALLLCINSVRQSIMRVLLPGDPDITKTGITHLIEDVRSGESITDAFSSFCSFIINSA